MEFLFILGIILAIMTINSFIRKEECYEAIEKALEERGIEK